MGERVIPGGKGGERGRERGEGRRGREGEKGREGGGWLGDIGCVTPDLIIKTFIKLHSSRKVYMSFLLLYIYIWSLETLPLEAEKPSFMRAQIQKQNCFTQQRYS